MSVSDDMKAFKREPKDLQPFFDAILTKYLSPKNLSKGNPFILSTTECIQGLGQEVNELIEALKTGEDPILEAADVALFSYFAVRSKENE